MAATGQSVYPQLPTAGYPPDLDITEANLLVYEPPLADSPGTELRQVNTQ